jgi:hypothetical protein
MEVIINAIGLGNSIWIIYNKSSRKYFCVCDKITIGDSTPQCALGVLAHSVSLLFALMSIGQYGFYLMSMWIFTLVYSGMHTYKSLKEICKGCGISYISSFSALFLNSLQLQHFPWVICFIYLSLILLSLCVTSVALKKRN